MDEQPWTNKHGRTSMDKQAWTNKHGQISMDERTGMSNCMDIALMQVNHFLSMAARPWLLVHACLSMAVRPLRFFTIVVPSPNLRNGKIVLTRDFTIEAIHAILFVDFVFVGGTAMR